MIQVKDDATKIVLLRPDRTYFASLTGKFCYDIVSDITFVNVIEDNFDLNTREDYQEEWTCKKDTYFYISKSGNAVHQIEIFIRKGEIILLQ